MNTENQNQKKEPGNPHLEKTFDGKIEDTKQDSTKQDNTEQDIIKKKSLDPDELFPDKNDEKGIAKDMNNRERDAEKIQMNEDKKNDDMEIELNKKVP